MSHLLNFNVTSPKVPSELVDSVELKCSAGQVLQPFNPFQVQSGYPANVGSWSQRCPKALGRTKSSHPLTPIIPILCLFLPILIIPSESSVTSPRTSATREEAGKGELLEASVPKLLELHWCGVNCPTGSIGVAPAVAKSITYIKHVYSVHISRWRCRTPSFWKPHVVFHD